MSNVSKFGTTGDGKTDDTAAIVHAVKDGDGVLRFPRGVYRITRTIEIPLDRVGPIGIDGRSGTAKILMAGPGPAFRFIGTHQGTGDPESVKPAVWATQRMPTVQNIEIEGAHPQADGIELIETMQAVFESVLVRKVRHGIRLHRRNRNVLVSHCHIYHNTGVGIFLDRVNLHQINIAGNHISYNRLGGIRIEGSEVRNLQITGNDIEYNNYHAHNTRPTPTAEIYIDTTAPKASVAEVTIASNTIQATPSPGGANLRIVETPDRDRPVGLWAISGNVIGNQEINVHLTGCHGVVLSGNQIYSCGHRNLLIEKCSQITVGSCNFRRHTPRLHTGVRLEDSTDCVLNGCIIKDEAAEGQSTAASLIEIVRCRRITVNACHVLDGVPYGLDVRDSSLVNISSCTVVDTREKRRLRGAIRFVGRGAHNLVSGNTFGQTLDEILQIDADSGVKLSNNLTGA